MPCSCMFRNYVSLPDGHLLLSGLVVPRWDVHPTVKTHSLFQVSAAAKCPTDSTRFGTWCLRLFGVSGTLILVPQTMLGLIRSPSCPQFTCIHLSHMLHVPAPGSIEESHSQSECCESGGCGWWKHHSQLQLWFGSLCSSQWLNKK